MMWFRRPFRQPVWSQIACGRGLGVLGCGVITLLVLFLAANLIQSARAAEAKDDSAGWRTVEVPRDATNGLGSWIWAAQTSDKQICQLWRSFEIPRGAKVSRAILRITADNGFRLLLDGRELGQGTEWRALTEYDLTLLLSAGKHTLGVIAFNDFLQAGMILGLRIELADGGAIQIKSDESWRIAPNGEPNWETKTAAPAHWPSAKIVVASSSLWWSDRPLDFVIVPQLRPIKVFFWHRTWFHVALVSLCGIVFLVCIRLMTQLIVQNKEQQLLNLERSRIARDIHDDVGTRLTKLVLQGEVAQSTLPANSEVRHQFDLICEGLREVLGAMDEVLWAVNPRHDTLANFIAYLCDYAQVFLQNTKIQCRLEVEPDIPPFNFDLPLRRSLLLAVKEALNNAAKHSDASRLVLKIYRTGHKLVVVVEDNGRGFDLNQTKHGRNGLTNLFQRMREAGGECQIMTRPGEGCRVEFCIPLTRRLARNWFLNRTQQPAQEAHLIELGPAAPGDAEETNKAMS
ncbi:MAG TPA: ATP-binding protein [Candidatus Limnocylindrales bacterium]|nr:ATP-binding protein [Candidatus Limnocylindrales bacterium]